MSRRLLVVTAVEREAEAVGALDGATIVVGGVGRTNAAVATTRGLLHDGPFDAVISAGVAGALPDAPCSIGDVVVGTHAVYAEEGVSTPTGFQDMTSLGFPLGPFEGNVVPADASLGAALSGLGTSGVIATVATCSGTDEAARVVQGRTGAVAEAMEGAAVLHAAMIGGCPAIEIRAISNTTGDRDAQKWDLEAAFSALHTAMQRVGGLLEAT